MLTGLMIDEEKHFLMTIVLGCSIYSSIMFVIRSTLLSTDAEQLS